MSFLKLSLLTLTSSPKASVSIMCYLILIAECTKHALDAVVLSKNDRKIYEVNKEKLRKEAEHLTKVYQ